MVGERWVGVIREVDKGDWGSWKGVIGEVGKG